MRAATVTSATAVSLVKAGRVTSSVDASVATEPTAPSIHTTAVKTETERSVVRRDANNERRPWPRENAMRAVIATSAIAVS